MLPRQPRLHLRGRRRRRRAHRHPWTTRVKKLHVPRGIENRRPVFPRSCVPRYYNDACFSCEPAACACACEAHDRLWCVLYVLTRSC